MKNGMRLNPIRPNLTMPDSAGTILIFQSTHINQAV